MKTKTNLIRQLFSKEPVLMAATILALLSMLFVPPDAAYLGYIDLKTLCCLLCLMISLKGIERAGLLHVVSMRLTERTKSRRGLLFLLVFLCFFASMFITNDVALLALVPITLSVLSVCGLEQWAAFVIVLQTLAANIGSSLTPIGNPQNLFLFMRYEFTLGSFLAVTAPFVLLGGVLLAAACLFIPNEPIRRETVTTPPVSKKLATASGVLFLLSVTVVFGLIPYEVAALIVLAAMALIDRGTLKHVDYSLLFTFAAIFILVGNIARIEALQSLISAWTSQDTMLTAVIASQVISNVPAAVMLSGFTENANSLLAGVNIGGMGTLIASMASVISYKLYTGVYSGSGLHFIKAFSLLNVLFLLLLFGAQRVLFGS
jgi:Na+/H+ antiporter NhaD/arsenite permease-like protein